MDQFKKVLAIHCHSTGLDFNSKDITNNNQALSISLMVIDLKNLKIVDKIYKKIKFDDKKYSWNKYTEKFHGITYEESLLGEDLEDVTASLTEFIMNHYSVNEPIITFGYAIHSFHLPFLKKIFKEYEMEFKFDDRCIDGLTFSTILDIYDSKELLINFGLGDKRQMTSEQINQSYFRIYKFLSKMVRNKID